MVKIGLDYGHGIDTFPPGKGVYKNGKGYAEHDFNTTLGLKVKELLEAQGHTVVEGQPANKADVPLTQRTDLYNREKVDLVWSIHANANSSSGVHGRCAFYWHNAKGSKQLAELYIAEVKKAGYSTHGNGLHASKLDSWTNLHINRETNMTAVLTENGFMTNGDDFDLIFGSKQDEYTSIMAKVHVKAIQRFLNEEFKTSKPKAEKPKTKSKPNKKYKGNSIIDYLNANKIDSSFSNRRKLAEKYGIRNYRGTGSQNLKLLKGLRGNKKHSSTLAGKRAEAKVASINFYDSPRWSNPSGTFKKGEGWTIIDKITTDGSPQLKVKNSRGNVYYITARKDLINIK